MTIKPIKTEEDYNEALEEVEKLMDAEKSSDDFDRLDLLATLIESYEAKYHPIDSPDPIAAIEYEMEKRGLTRRDLEPLLGPSGRVSEVLNRQRPLTVKMMRQLHRKLGISGNVLLADYSIRRSRAKT
jgi:HTH-type transcriptional regulator/antitoxin HigA